MAGEGQGAYEETSTRHHGRGALLITAVLTVVVLCVGIWGFLAQQCARGPLDAAYKTIQLFTLNFPECRGPLNLQIEVARFGAAGFLLTGLVLIVWSSIAERSRLWWQYGVRPRDRVVLLGFGAINSVLARHHAQRGRAITAVDRSFDEADRALAGRHRISLVAGDLMDQATFERARLHRAADIYVACGNDVVNVEVAKLASRYIRTRRKNQRPSRPSGASAREDAKSGPSLHFHVSSAQLADDLRDARDIEGEDRTPAFPYCVKLDAARRLIEAGQFVVRARALGQRRVHLALVGCGDLGEAVLIEAVQICQSAHLEPPRITILDKDHRTVRARLRSRRPRLFDGSIPREARPQLDFLAFDADVSSFEEKIIDDEPPTAWIFCCAGDRLNLSAALGLELAMHRLIQAPAPIYPRLWSPAVGFDPAEQSTAISLICPFAHLEVSVSSAEPAKTAWESLARSMHEYYYRKANRDAATASQRFVQTWKDLPETAKEANRRAARHAAVKLTDLGFQWRGAEQGQLPRLTDVQAQQLHDELETFARQAASTDQPEPHHADHPMQNDRIAQACFVEHRRWMVDRAIDGWRPAEERDNRRRRHPNIKPFAKLDAATQVLDLEVLRALIEWSRTQMDPSLPRAWPRNDTTITLDKNGIIVPEPADLTACTQLNLLCPVEFETFDTEKRSLVEARIAEWASLPEACVLVVHLAGPVEYIPRGSPELAQKVADFLRNLPALVGNDISFAVLRKYAAMSLPDVSADRSPSRQITARDIFRESVEGRRRQPLALRVGVTGHRLDKLAGTDLALLRRQAGAILAYLAEQAHDRSAEKAAASSAALSSGEPPLQLATSIAQGADQIVAEAAIEHDFALDLILPFSRETYALDFEGAALESFHRLLGHRAVWRRTELAVTDTPHDPRGYRAAGQVMLDHADVLIAIWDGQPAAGVGGTAEVVREAQRRGMTVLWLTPDGVLRVECVAPARWAPRNGRLDGGRDSSTGRSGYGNSLGLYAILVFPACRAGAG